MPATRALAELRAVHVLCPTNQEAFWKAAGIAEVHRYDSSSKASALPSMEQCLLWEDGTAAKAVASAKVKSRLGLPAGRLSKRLNQPLTITQKIGPATHQVQLFLGVATQLGVGAFESRHFAPLSSPISREPGSLLISPDSDFGSHYTWSTERWIELIAALPLSPEQARLQGNGPIAMAIAAETDLEIVSDLEPQPLAGFERCIAADSSIAHLAAAYGATCAVLFGPGDPEITRPLGKQHLSIRKKVECSPCGLSRCPLDLRCQVDLDVERVVHALRSFVER